MKCFLLDLGVISEINRKEEITPSTFLISDEEEELINSSLANGGGVFPSNKPLTLIITGPRPNEYSVWNTQSKSWVIDNELKQSVLAEKRSKVWEKIKDIRTRKLESGCKVEINGEFKWFHTDLVSQQSYTRAVDYLANNPQVTISWKTMDNSFVNLNYKSASKVTSSIFETGQKIFQFAEILKHKVDLSELPEEIDLDQGWPEVYLS